MNEIRKQVLKPNWEEFDVWDTGQKRGEEKPPLVKPYGEDALLFDLIPMAELINPSKELFKAICDRRSVRKYSEEAITLNELTYLLVSTNGILDLDKPLLRIVPSAGARHAIETYLYIENVEGLKCGLYRYLPHEHKLLTIHFNSIRTIKYGLSLTFGAPLTFLWTAVPSRMEWRYGPATEKLLLLDAGHICQNLYLSCEALNMATCAVGAYDQKGIDTFMQLDGEEEFLIYAAPVGKKKS